MPRLEPVTTAIFPSSPRSTAAEYTRRLPVAASEGFRLDTTVVTGERPSCEIVIARHGETAWNADGRFQGHADVPLNERGQAQAVALAERMASARARFDALYASDLARAYETAEIVGRRLGLTPTPEARLREIDVGSWSGLTRFEIEEQWPGALARWGTDDDVHDGESRASFATRVVESAREIGVRHAGSRVLLVAHGGVVRSLQRAVTGAPEAVLENCGTWDFVVAGDGTLRPADRAGQAARGASGAAEPIV